MELVELLNIRKVTLLKNSSPAHQSRLCIPTLHFKCFLCLLQFSMTHPLALFDLWFWILRENNFSPPSMESLIQESKPPEDWSPPGWSGPAWQGHNPVVLRLSLLSAELNLDTHKIFCSQYSTSSWQKNHPCSYRSSGPSVLDLRAFLPLSDDWLDLPLAGGYSMNLDLHQILWRRFFFFSPLSPLYRGPYKVINRRTGQILGDSKLNTFSVNRLKPVFSNMKLSPALPPWSTAWLASSTSSASSSSLSTSW